MENVLVLPLLHLSRLSFSEDSLVFNKRWLSPPLYIMVKNCLLSIIYVFAVRTSEKIAPSLCKY